MPETETVIERPALHEDAVRFIRQHLLALEEGRKKDAQTIQDYVADEFGTTFVVVDVDEVASGIRNRWHSYYGLPWYFNADAVEQLKPDLKAFDKKSADQAELEKISEKLTGLGLATVGPGTYAGVTREGARRVAVLPEYANEPIFRIPSDHATRGPGVFETPIHLLLDFRPPWDTEDPYKNEAEHQRPRAKGSDLPEEVAKAIRPWTPATE